MSELEHYELLKRIADLLQQIADNTAKPAPKPEPKQLKTSDEVTAWLAPHVRTPREGVVLRKVLRNMYHREEETLAVIRGELPATYVEFRLATAWHGTI